MRFVGDGVEFLAMRRLLFAILLFVVPFQLVWGAAVPYCEHETKADAAKHFGHHEHRHQAGDVASAAADDNGSGPGTYDSDCAICHLGTFVPHPSAVMAIASVPRGAVHSDPGPDFRSHIPAGLERPDRAELTSAARFVGGVAIGSPSA